MAHRRGHEAQRGFEHVAHVTWLPGLTVPETAWARATICVVGGHHHHSHVQADSGRLKIALALILGFMAVEVVVAVLADSLALLSDAAHMLTDAGAIALAILAARLARRPAAGGFTFGMRRAEILSAQLNGATLLALAAVIVLEGVRRLISPPDVEGGAVIAVAIAGIVVRRAPPRDRRRLSRPIKIERPGVPPCEVG